MFDRYIGIDYSGANTPVARINGLVVYQAGRDALPGIVFPETDDCDLWSRKLLAQWLVREIQNEERRTLVGIDHGFGFPAAYFDLYDEIPRDDWESFLKDFQEYWPTDGDDVWVRDFVDNPDQGRRGRRNWLRLTDHAADVTSSVFKFSGQGQVGHSTHAGLPWLLYIRRELRNAGVGVHFWPFDDWVVPEGRSAIVEVYPALFHPLYSDQNFRFNLHRRDAYSVARWMAETDRKEELEGFFNPIKHGNYLDRARMEGWILGAEWKDPPPMGN